MSLRPILVLPIVALAVAGCALPPAGYRNPDLQADYVIGNHLFDVRAVRADSGYDVYVAERGGVFLSDVILLDTAAHLEAAEIVVGSRCRDPSLVGDWRTFGHVGYVQPSIGIIARFNCV